jgi:hypothetical protein
MVSEQHGGTEEQVVSAYRSSRRLVLKIANKVVVREALLSHGTIHVLRTGPGTWTPTYCFRSFVNLVG